MASLNSLPRIHNHLPAIVPLLAAWLSLAVTKWFQGVYQYLHHPSGPHSSVLTLQHSEPGLTGRRPSTSEINRQRYAVADLRLKYITVLDNKLLKEVPLPCSNSSSEKRSAWESRCCRSIIFSLCPTTAKNRDKITNTTQDFLLFAKSSN